MKIGIQTWGSAGDIRPFIALAGELSSNGHNVTLQAFSIDKKDYQEIANRLRFKLEIHSMNNDLYKMALRVSKTKNPLKQGKIAFEETLFPILDTMYESALRLCKNSDMVIGHHITSSLKAASYKTGCPLCNIFLIDKFIPTKYSPPIIPIPSFGKMSNIINWKILDKTMNIMLKKEINDFRKRHNIEPIKSVLKDWQSKQLNIIAVSKTFSKMQPDWNNSINITGFLEIPVESEKWKMSKVLKKFLEKKEKPIFISFGSMTQVEVQKTTEFFIEVAKFTKRRAIIQTDLTKVTNLPKDDNLYFIRNLPHHEIFPYCALVVHHGGAGTTHSVTRCGLPSVVVCHGFDQKYWGETLKIKGIGGKVFYRKTVLAKELAEEINRVYTNNEMKKNCKRTWYIYN